MNSQLESDPRYRALADEWHTLDAAHFDAKYQSMDAGGVSDRVRLIEDRMRFVHHALEALAQDRDPLSVDELEAARLERLAHAKERSTYRLTARPFLHEKRWWEPGYVPEGAADLRGEGRMSPALAVGLAPPRCRPSCSWA